MKKLILILSIPILVFSCKIDDSPKGDPAAALNEDISLPSGSFQVDPEEVEVDNSISLTNNSSGSTAGTITPGTQSTMQLTFSTTKKNIVAAGMRFGDSGPINMVPIPGAKGSTSGTLTVPFTVSQSTCDKLSSICHDIKCYEFAMTSDGKISKANIRDIALLCGNCDEPSCKDLISPPCTSDPGNGNGTWTFRGSTYTGVAGCTSVGDVIATTSGNSLAIYNVSSGTVSLQDYTGDNFDITSDPYILVNVNGTIYATKSGTISKSSTSTTFNVVVQDIMSGSTYSVSGSMKCK